MADSAGVPEGWKLVPKEPTEAMIQASRAVVVNGVSGHKIPRLPNDPTNWADRKAALRYRAMLAASPTPPSIGVTLPSEEEFVDMGIRCTESIGGGDLRVLYKEFLQLIERKNGRGA